MRKSLLFIVILFMLICTLGNSAFGEARILKLGHVYTVGHPWHEGALLAAELIAKKSNGRIEVEIYPAGQLGSESDQLEQLIQGSLDILAVGPSQIGNMYTPFNILDMPYLFRGYEHGAAFCHSEIAKEMAEKLRKKFGIRILSYSLQGTHAIIANKPIQTPDDLKGFRLRIPEQRVMISTAKAFGAIPSVIAYTEAYMALQQGIVDGLGNPITSISTMKFYECMDYVSLTKHIIGVCTYSMNDNIFNSFSEKDQQIILEAFDEAGKFVINRVREEEKTVVTFFENEGLTVCPIANLEPFMQKVQPMYEQYSDWWEDEMENLPAKIRLIKSK